MSEFTNLAENFSTTARDQGSRDASSALFDASWNERNNTNHQTDVDDAIKSLTDQGTLPIVSFEYLNAGPKGGSTNFEAISNSLYFDNVITKDELNQEISTLDAKGSTFSSALVSEIRENYDKVADLDGEAGISSSDYKKFIQQQETGVVDSTTATVQAGDGFDRIARRLYKETLGKDPSAADVMALSERIAELNGNDREYSNGQIHPGQELKMLSKAELEKFVEERSS